MAIRAVGAEGDDDVRLDAAQVLFDRLLRDRRRHGVERTIGIPKYADLTYAQLAGSGTQLRFARLRDDVVRRPLAIAEPPALTPRRRQQVGFDTFRCVLRQRAARPQRFIVGMSQDAHEPWCHRITSFVVTAGPPSSSDARDGDSYAARRGPPGRTGT